MYIQKRDDNRENSQIIIIKIGPTTINNNNKQRLRSVKKLKLTPKLDSVQIQLNIKI